MLYTGILCGNFSTYGAILEPDKIDNRWEHIQLTEEFRRKGHCFYYPKFYDLCYGDKNRGIKGFERYEMTIDKDMVLTLDDSECNIHIANIALYVCPMDIALYSIELNIETVNRQDISRTMFLLRNITGFANERTKSTLQPFIDSAITPLMKCRQAITPNAEISYRDMITFGNKLKIFQIIDIDEEVYYSDYSNITLYEFATLTYLPDHNLKAAGAPSEQYFNMSIEKNMLSVFNNWKALSLFDTFTIMGTNITSSVPNWRDNYFGMIYLYDTFVKCYLFNLNNNYSKTTSKGILSTNLNDETYNQFETHYYFPDISYNFLPRMVHTYISKALEIDEEKKRIFERIERQNNISEKCADTRMNKFLFAMTCLTIISTIWDGKCLIDNIISLNNTLSFSFIVFHLIPYIIILAIFVYLIISFLRRS